MVREAYEEELQEILRLYLHLHEDRVPQDSQHLQDTWAQILHDPNHHLIVKEVDGKIVSS